MDKLRVLIFTGWYPNGNNAVKGVFVREQVRALHKSGLEVALLYPFDEEIPSGKLGKSWEEGIRVYRAHSMALRNRYLARLYSYFVSWRLLRKLSDEFQPDLLHVHVGYPAAMIAYFFTRKHKIPYLITEHMSFLQDYVAKFRHRVLLRRAFEKAALVLPVSAALAEQIRGFGWKTTLQVVPNVVDTERFSPGKADREGRVGVKDRVNILFVGGLDETQVKGLQFLLPAFAALVKETPARLRVLGDGMYRPRYEKQAEELDISGYCTFQGWVNPAAMPDYYRDCDFLVLSSLKETFGCVLLEAMACGKPVLATACGGPQSIVKAGTGLLVAPGDVSALEQGLKEMVRRLSQFDSKFIRAHVERHYGSQALAEKLSGIYQEIANDSAKRYSYK